MERYLCSYGKKRNTVADLAWCIVFFDFHFTRVFLLLIINVNRGSRFEKHGHVFYYLKTLIRQFGNKLQQLARVIHMDKSWYNITILFLFLFLGSVVNFLMLIMAVFTRSLQTIHNKFICHITAISFIGKIDLNSIHLQISLIMIITTMKVRLLNYEIF